VGAVPGSAFFYEPINKYMRLHFAKNKKTLEEALERLSKIYEKMPVKTLIVFFTFQKNPSQNWGGFFPLASDC
jgi:hypothetical protein